MIFSTINAKDLITQHKKFQISTLKINTIIWHCKKNSDYFWTRVYIRSTSIFNRMFRILTTKVRLNKLIDSNNWPSQFQLPLQRWRYCRYSVPGYRGMCRAGSRARQHSWHWTPRSGHPVPLTNSPLGPPCRQSQSWLQTNDIISAGQNGGHFTDDIFRLIFVNDKFCILIKVHWNLFLRVQLTISQHWFR